MGLISAGCKALGIEFSRRVLEATANPVAGLMIGLIATAVVQSSSSTTSLVVGMVGAGTLSLENAVPILMGANIGTTITNIIVAFGHITRREEFRRAFAGAVVHDLFNIMAVIVLLPLELATGYLRHTAEWLAGLFDTASGVVFTSPVKLAIAPIVHGGLSMLRGAGLSPHGAAVGGILLGAVLLIGSVAGLVKIMRGLIAGQFEALFDRWIGRSAILALALGAAVTAMVQSSSITTSVLVPIIGAGLLSIEGAFPVVLGANVGTTVTAFLASLTGNTAAVAAAFVHVLFNLTGIALVYPVRAIRMIPVRGAEWLGAWIAERRCLAVVYVSSVFFVLPLLLMVLVRWIG